VFISTRCMPVAVLGACPCVATGIQLS
jgi:hypothetical protein